MVEPMERIGGILALSALLAWPAMAGAAVPEPEERESEYEMPAGEAWRQPGFRVQLRVGHESVADDDGLGPDAAGLTLGVEPGIRLSRWFSLSATLRYTRLVGGFDGMRWSSTADLTWHPWGGGFFLAAGVGYAGLLGNREFDISRPSRCDGDGLVALARTGWLFPMGELFSTGPIVQLDEQWTRCAGEEREVFAGEPSPESPASFDTKFVRGEGFSWRHHSLHFAWSLAWR